MQLDYDKRVVVTAAAVAITLVGNAWLLPGVPAELLDTAFAPRSLFPPDQLRVLSPGIMAYLSASAIWLLLSGMIERLGLKRDGTAAERVAFDSVIVWLALGLAFVQGIAHGVYIQNILALAGFMGQGPSVVPIAVTVSAATAILIAIALFATRAGVGNGVAWVALATSLAVLPTSVPVELARLRESDVGYFRLPMAGAALVGLVALCCVYLRSRQEVVLVPIEGRDVPLPHAVPPLPIRINLIGIVPAAVAGALLSLPAVFGPMFANPPRWLSPSPPVYWTLFAVLTIVLSYVCVGIGFDTRRVGPMLERYGYRIAGVQGQSTEEYLDKLIERRILPSAAILIGIVALPGPVLGALTGIDLSRAGIPGTLVLVACAMVLDTVRNTRALRIAEPGMLDHMGAVTNPGDEASGEDVGIGRAPGDETTDDRANPDVSEKWTVVFESDVEFETRLALAALEARGIHGLTMSNRVVPLTGTLAFWEWTAPTHPSLVIHRRLGGGKAVLRVPKSEAHRAREVLADLAAA